MKAARHPHEAARLGALRSYDILDTPRESDFDEIVMLASQICGTPISVINLIDEHRQWFKAETGLGVRETPLETSICAHAILQEDFVEIPDTRADPRMADNPLCLGDPSLRFYAGALLRAKGGYPIGTLCVLANEPRTLTPFQRSAMTTLANQVMTQLDLRALVASEAALRSEIDHRVKNSLQSVNSFVALERRAAGDDHSRAAMERVTRQINMVSALHDHLAMSRTGETIELGPYLEQVVSLIDSSLAADIKIQGRFDSVAIGSREASIIATIINELAANAAKHSFRGAAGTVSLSGECLGNTGYRLTCSDNGGTQLAAPAPDPGGRVGLGLRILTASIRQLGGSMTVKQDDRGYATSLDLNLTPV